MLFNLYIEFFFVKINIVLYFVIYIACDIMALKNYSICLEKTSKVPYKFVNNEEIMQ